ncbi:MAG TPA: ExeM/NucH family extracellular endonuclease, partial [Thermoanaerobaculia bacterium]
DTLTVSEYFELGRYGQIVLAQGGRPFQFSEHNPPSVAGLAAWEDGVARREVILDDDNNAQEWYLTSSTPPGPPDGSQFVFYPQANGGFSVGTQGVDFFRGGDVVNGLTGVLHWSFPGFGNATWRIRPAAAHPVTFTVANPRPVTPPAVGGAIKAVGMNLLNYFTTIDTTSSNTTGPCGPSGGQDCRGADSVAELNRQRERASVVICTLNADVYAFMELENTTPSDTINDILGAVNARCGGAHPYAFVNTGGTLGTDAIRVQQIYRTGIVSPVGSPLVDLDPIHNRPPTAQIYDVVDATNPAFGKRFTAIANHFKSKGSCPTSGPDTDQNDGQSCWNATRTQQATRLLTWINGTVIPAAGDPDVLLLGDFNSYAHEDPVTTLEGGGYTDLETSFDPNTYSYLFSAELGHLDYGFASTSLLPQITGAAPWHINADEVDLFDYNDEIRDVGEATFEEKPDGSALVPPRVVFQPATPYRASDHDPVLVGLFPVADLAITKTDGVTTASPGGSVTYTITASNAGPNNETGATVADTFPAALTCTWTCVGAGGGTCTASGSGNLNDTVSLPAGGSVTYTASCTISASATGSISNTATVTNGTTSDSNAANNSATDTDTLTPQADLSITKTDGVTTATAGGSVTYTITASNAGPSNAPGATVADTFPASLTCTWTCAGAGGGTCTASGSGNINNTVNLPSGGSVTYTASCTVSAAATGTLANTATVTAPAGVTDPTPGNNSATDSDTLAASADLSITKTDGVTTAAAGGSVTYTITASNAGPSNAPGATVADIFPASLTCTWTCVGAGGGTCTASGSGNINGTVNLPSGGSVTYTASCAISVLATGTLSNTATVTAPAGVTDPAPANNSATDTDTLGTSADLSITKVDTPDPVTPGGNITYTITVTNAGPSNAANVSLSDTVPAGTSAVSLVAPGGWSCPPVPTGLVAGSVITCTAPSLGVSSSVFTLTVATFPSLTTGTVITNTASVTSSTPDPNPGNESATATTTVTSNPGAVSLVKTAFPFPSVVAGNGLLYDIKATNSSGGNLGAVTVTDVLPSGTTFSSLNGVPAGWSCVTPPVGTTGTVTCSAATFAPGLAEIGFFVIVSPSVPAGTVLSNTAHLVTTDGGTPIVRDSTTTTTVTTPGVIVYGTKTASAGPHPPGSALTYTIVLHNNGSVAQGDNPGNELTDVLPSGLTLVSATASSGTPVATVATRTVTWNGSIPAGGSVTITINATIDANVAPGTTLNNQATFAFDSDGNGTNESSGMTDDPTVAGTANPTPVVVAGGEPIPVPTLDGIGLLLLALLLAMGGAVVLRRRRA